MISLIIGLAGGVVIAFACYLVSLFFLKKHQSLYAASTVVRQILSVGYLAALFLVGQKLSADVKMLLIGGALGVTLPSFIFTARLVKRSDGTDKKEKRDE